MKQGFKRGQGLDSRREKYSPGKRNNRSLFCIQIDQTLRNKLERERAGIIFLLSNFAICIRMNKELFLPLWHHHGALLELEKGAVPHMSTRGQSCCFYRCNSEYNQR